MTKDPKPAKRAAAHTRAAIGLAALGVAVIGATAASTTAAFTDRVEANAQVEAGSLAITVSDSAGRVTERGDGVYDIDLPVAVFQPGATAQVDLQVTNTGTLPATLRARTVNAPLPGPGTTAGLASQLTVSATSGGASLYSGKLSALTFAGHPMPAGATTPLRLNITVPTSLTNAWQGARDQVTITVVAEQATGA